MELAIFSYVSSLPDSCDLIGLVVMVVVGFQVLFASGRLEQIAKADESGHQLPIYTRRDLCCVEAVHHSSHCCWARQKE